jgi:hypothetical protein
MQIYRRISRASLRTCLNANGSRTRLFHHLRTVRAVRDRSFDGGPAMPHGLLGLDEPTVPDCFDAALHDVTSAPGWAKCKVCYALDRKEQ